VGAQENRAFRATFASRPKPISALTSNFAGGTGRVPNKRKKRQKAANLCVFMCLQQASQALDTGSIPVARSKFHPLSGRSAKAIRLIKPNKTLYTVSKGELQNVSKLYVCIHDGLQIGVQHFSDCNLASCRCALGL
jgi:hypothetical protein